MTTKTSISRISYRRRPARLIKRAALIISVLALVLIAAIAYSFTTANDLMRQKPKALATFSSNIMPDYRLVSFASLDEQTMLSGWFFPAEGEAYSTVVLVHDQGKNRLQFGLDSPDFYRHLVEKGLNVLAFDQRNSGQSDGELSGYGYAEWSDVLAAVRYARKNAATKNVLLYGFGTGVSASLIAWDQLPPAGIDKKDYPENIRKLDFDQSYIIGLMLDSPAASPDDYIRVIYRRQGWLGNNLLQYTVPYAVRLSAGSIGKVNLTALLSRCQLPVFLAYQTQDTWIGSDSILPLVDERQRLNPDLTVVYACDKPGYTDGFLLDRTGYLAALDGFLARFFTQSGK